MSQHSFMITLVLTVLAVVWFGRHLLVLLSALLMAVFCLGLYEVVGLMHHV
jgi:hypothetical protein